MSHANFFKQSIPFAVLGLFFAGCGPSSPSSPVAPTTDPSTPIVTLSKPTTISQQPAVAVSPTPNTLPVVAKQIASPMPTVSIASADQVLLGVYDNSNTPNGPETLTLLNDGRYSQQVQAYSITVTGTWAISAGQLAFFQTEVSGTDNICNNTMGTYRWTLASKALTFTVVNDKDCPYRQEDFTSGPWLKRP